MCVNNRDVGVAAHFCQISNSLICCRIVIVSAHNVQPTLELLYALYRLSFPAKYTNFKYHLNDAWVVSRVVSGWYPRFDYHCGSTSCWSGQNILLDRYRPDRISFPTIYQQTYQIAVHSGKIPELCQKFRIFWSGPLENL